MELVEVTVTSSLGAKSKCSIKLSVIGAVIATWIFGQSQGQVDAQPVVSGTPWVNVGTTTTLQCTPTSSNTLRTLDWRNSSFDATDYRMADIIVHYTVNVTIRDSVHYSFNKDDPSYPMMVNTVTLDDEARYWCNALTDNNRASFFDVRIRVPAGTINILYGGVEYSNGASFKVISGDNHQITCSTPGVKPASTITWTLPASITTDQPGGSQTNTPNSGDDRLTDSSNTITVNIAETPATAQLTCGATNRQDGLTDAEVSLTVTVQVIVTPKTVKLSDTDGDKVEGDTVIVNQGSSHPFSCRVPGTRPAATIQWFVDDVVQSYLIVTPPPTESNQLFDVTSTWSFTPGRAHHRQAVKCEANSVDWSQRYVATVTLDVNGPPNDPNIQGNTLMTEDVASLLTCTAQEGYPQGWSLGWSNVSSDGDIDIPGASPDLPSLINNRYTFTSRLSYIPSRYDNGNNIRCTAEWNLWTPQPQSTIGLLNVQFCTRSVIVTQNSQFATAGSTVTLRCDTSESSNPATKLAWFKGSVELTTPNDQPNAPGDYGGRVTTVIFTTGVLDKTNNGDVYKCCATNPTIPSCVTTPLCDTYMLNVRYPPEFTSLTVTPTAPVNEGSDVPVTLTCTVDANPTTVGINWKRNAPSDAFNPTNGVTSTLIISNIKREQAGYYTCTANNGVPNDNPTDEVSSPITVIVHYEVNITNKAMTEVGVKDGDLAVLPCVAVGNPMPVIAWYSPNNTQIISDDRMNVTTEIVCGDNVFGFKVSSKLTIGVVNSQVDYGVYTCNSSNGIDKRDSLKITLTGTRRPDPPTGVGITNRTASSLTVRWTVGYHGGEPQSFRVRYFKTSDDSEVFSQETGEETTSTATGLDAYTQYEIRVYAKNAVGENQEYGSVTVYTRPKPPDPDSGITVEFNKVDGTVKVEGLTGNGGIQLEVLYQGNAAWFECGECIVSDETVMLSDHCPKQQKRRRRAVGDIKDVRARLCIDGVCSQPAGVKEAPKPTNPSGPDIAIIVGGVVGGLILVAIIAVLIGYLVRTSLNRRSGKEGDGEFLNMKMKDVRPIPKRTVIDTQSPYQEINELDIISHTVLQEPGTAAYANVSVGHRAFLRDQLKIIKELGHGAFGQVLLAEASGMTQGSEVALVAVKTLKDGAGQSDRAGMLRELDLMKKLPDHDNVVRLLGFCVEKDPPYIIVEYLSRGNLKELLKDSRSKGGHVYGNLHGISKSLTSKDLMKFANDVADGMDFISSQQCIHRDLAARNVLVAEDMTCKVSDFGLARDVMNTRVYERGSEGALPMRWMALESLVDDVYTTESDVWSYGVLLWEIVTLGARPYSSMTAKIMVGELQSGYRMPKPQHCQDELYVMMLRCWYEDPESRPTFEMISKELDKLIGKGKEYISIKDFQESIYEVVLKEDAGEKV